MTSNVEGAHTQEQLHAVYYTWLHVTPWQCLSQGAAVFENWTKPWKWKKVRPPQKSRHKGQRLPTVSLKLNVHMYHSHRKLTNKREKMPVLESVSANEIHRKLFDFRLSDPDSLKSVNSNRVFFLVLRHWWQRAPKVSGSWWGLIPIWHQLGWAGYLPSGIWKLNSKVFISLDQWSGVFFGILHSKNELWRRGSFFGFIHGKYVV